MLRIKYRQYIHRLSYRYIASPQVDRLKAYVGFTRKFFDP
jgi:hypothetical protein